MKIECVTCGDEDVRVGLVDTGEKPPTVLALACSLPHLKETMIATKTLGARRLVVTAGELVDLIAPQAGH